MNRADSRTPRVQVYFENPKTELALRREARAAKLSLSRAAEAAIVRGLQRRPHADPEDRLLHLDQALRGHMRSTQRDMTILLEMVVDLARALFVRLPDAPADSDPLLQAAVEARIQRFLNDAVAGIISGRTRGAADPAPTSARPSAAAAE